MNTYIVERKNGSHVYDQRVEADNMVATNSGALVFYMEPDDGGVEALILAINATEWVTVRVNQ